MMIATHAGGNPAAVVPVEALESRLVEACLLIFHVWLLEQPSHLHVLHLGLWFLSSFPVPVRSLTLSLPPPLWP